MLPWFKIYAAELLSDERFQGWSVEERGAWFTLVCVAWREGSIPQDMVSLARLLHTDANAMRSLWSAIGDRFVEHPDHPGRLTSPRLEMEREASERMVEQKSAAGKAGATSRWHKTKRGHGTRMRMPSDSNATACDRDATAMANDSDQNRSEQTRTAQRRSEALEPQKLTPREQGALDRNVPLPQEHPSLALLLGALRTGGLPLSMPNSLTTRDQLEMAVAGLGTDRAAEVVREAHAADPNPSLGWYTKELYRAYKAPKRVNGAADPGRWWERAPADVRERFLAERVAIDPELTGDAPFQSTGVDHIPEVRALISRYAGE